MSKELLAALVDHPLAHLGADEGNARLLDEAGEHLARPFAVGGGADHHQRVLRLLQQLDALPDRLLLGRRTPDSTGCDQRCVDALGGDVLRQLEVHRPGLLLHGDPAGFADPGRDIVAGDDLLRVLGQGPHHVDHVDDLKLSLLARLDRLLAADHQHRHPAQLGVGSGGDQIGGPGPESRQADTGPSGQAAVGGGHEPRGLLVAGQDQPDLGPDQRVEQIEVLCLLGPILRHQTQPLLVHVEPLWSECGLPPWPECGIVSLLGDRESSRQPAAGPSAASRGGLLV